MHFSHLRRDIECLDKGFFSPGIVLYVEARTRYVDVHPSKTVWREGSRRLIEQWCTHFNSLIRFAKLDMRSKLVQGRVLLPECQVMREDILRDSFGMDFRFMEMISGCVRVFGP